MRNEIAFKNHEEGIRVARTLLNEEYVVMLSYEDDFLIVSYEQAPNADRNEVVFMSLDKYDEEISNIVDEVIDDIRNDIKSGYITSLSEI